MSLKVIEIAYTKQYPKLGLSLVFEARGQRSCLDTHFVTIWKPFCIVYSGFKVTFLKCPPIVFHSYYSAVSEYCLIYCSPI